MLEPTPCETCGHTDWKNPIPVVTIIQPVVCTDTCATGLAIARRAIPPSIGMWAMLGGHVDEGECLEVAAVREWKQETGLLLTEKELVYAGSHIGSNGKMLVGFRANPITLDYWSQAILCHENSAFGVLWHEDQIDDLCFSIHQRFAREWLDGK